MSAQVLRDANGDEPLRVKLDAVNIDEKGFVGRRLNFDTVKHEASLARAIRTMNEYVAATRELCANIEDLLLLLLPPLAELFFKLAVQLSLLLPLVFRLLNFAGYPLVLSCYGSLFCFFLALMTLQLHLFPPQELFILSKLIINNNFASSRPHLVHSQPYVFFLLNLLRSNPLILFIIYHHSVFLVVDNRKGFIQGVGTVLAIIAGVFLVLHFLN